MELRLRALPHRLAVCRLPPDAELPSWALEGPFHSVTRTGAELSVVCTEAAVPASWRATRIESVVQGWRALEVQGPLDFALTGVLASLASPLAAAGIPIFALSTFDTDYLLVRAERVEAAVETLRAAGHRVET